MAGAGTALRGLGSKVHQAPTLSGLGNAWRPELHPRDRFGRFRSKWKLSGSAERAVDGALSSFNPVTFRSEDEAGTWLKGKVTGRNHPGTMPGKPPAEVAAYLQNFQEANAAVKAGHSSPEITALDNHWEPTDEAMILTQVVGPGTFGLTPQNSDSVEEWTGKLVKNTVPNSTNLGTPMQAGPGDVTMYIAAPKGTKAIIPGNGREVLLDPSTTFRITHVQRNANGGHDVLAVALPGDAKGQGRVKELGTRLSPSPVTAEEKANVDTRAPFREVPGAPGAAVPQQGERVNAPHPVKAIRAPRGPRKPKEPNPLDQPPPGEEPSKLTGKTEKSAALHAWMENRKGYPSNPTSKDVQVTRDALDQHTSSDIRDAAKNAGLTVPAVKGGTKEGLVDSVTHQLIGKRAGVPEKRGAERLAPDTHAPSANAMHGERRRAAEAAAAAKAVPRESFTAPPAGQAPSEADIRARAVEAHQHAADAMAGGKPVRLTDVVKKMSDAGVSDGDIHAELRRMLDSGEMRRGTADGTVIHHPLGAQAQERAQILSDLKAAKKAAPAVHAPSTGEKATESPRTPSTPAPSLAPEKKATKSLQAPAKKAAPTAPTEPPVNARTETPSPASVPTPEPMKASLVQDATALRVKKNLGDNPDETKLMKGALDHEEAANHFRTLARNSENRAGAPASKKAAIAHYKAMAELHQNEAKSLRARAAKLHPEPAKPAEAAKTVEKATVKAAPHEAAKVTDTAVGKDITFPEHRNLGTRFANGALKDAKRDMARTDRPNDVVAKLRRDAEQLREEPVQDPRELVDNLSDSDPETMREISFQDATALEKVANDLEKSIGDAREKAGKDQAIQRKAEIRRETRNRPTPKPTGPTPAEKAFQENAKRASNLRMEQANKERDAHETAAHARFDPWLEKAGVKWSDLDELQRTGLLVVAGNSKLSKPEMIRRLRTKNGNSLLDKIANAAEAPVKAAPSKPDVTPAKPTFPDHPRPGTRFADNALKDAKKMQARGDSNSNIADHLRSNADQLRGEPVTDPRELVDNLSEPDDQTMREISSHDANSLDKVANDLEKAATVAPVKAAEKAAPAAPENPALHAAQTRQAHIDKLRPLANMAAAVNERHHETLGDSRFAEIMKGDQRQGLADIAKVPSASSRPDLRGKPLQGVEDIRNASPDELARKTAEVAKRNGITLHGSNGNVEPFDPKKHKVLGNRPEVGSPVQVVRPGTSVDHNGEHIQLDKAVVHGITADEVKAAITEGRKVDPKFDVPKAAIAKKAAPSAPNPASRSAQLDQIIADAGVDKKALAEQPKMLAGIREDLDNPKLSRAEVARKVRFLANGVSNSTAIQHGGHIGDRKDQSEEFKKENADRLAAGYHKAAELNKLADAIAKAKLAPHTKETSAKKTIPATKVAAPRVAKTAVPSKPAIATATTPKVHALNVTEAKSTGLTTELMSHVKNAKDEGAARELLGKVTVPTLEALAREHGVPIKGRMKKADLVDAIVTHGRGSGVPVAGNRPSVSDRVAARLLDRVQEISPEMHANVLNDLKPADRKLVEDAVNRVKGVDVPAATPRVKLPDVPSVPSGKKATGDMSKDELLDEAHALGISDTGNMKISELRDAVAKARGGTDARPNAAPAGNKPDGPPLRHGPFEISGGKDRNGRPIAEAYGRTDGDVPLHLPNSGNDQGLVHLDSQLGKLWVDLVTDKREPNSFVNKVAVIGEDVGQGKLSLDEAATRLRQLADRSVDRTIANRIEQAAFEITDAPPVPKIDVPETVPVPVRKWLEDLAQIPTFRKENIRGYRNKNQSVLDEILEMVREVSRDPRAARRAGVDRKLQMIAQNVHESVDGVYWARKLTDRLFVGRERVVDYRNGKAVTEPNPDFEVIDNWFRGK